MRLMEYLSSKRFERRRPLPSYLKEVQNVEELPAGRPLDPSSFQGLTSWERGEGSEKEELPKEPLENFARVLKFRQRCGLPRGTSFAI